MAPSEEAVADMDRWVEMVRETLSKLCSEDESSLVVVEGVRDEISLRSLGYSGRVVHLRNLNKYLETAGDVKKVILLLDFDREGLAMSKRVLKRLTAERVKVDTFYYRSLMAAKRLGVNTVQDLPHLLEGRR
jgi:5S rRNA maturation endonuclease (ribonuclease M5)